MHLLPIVPALALLPAALAVLPAAPPSGEPPKGPLERYEPKIYEVVFDVTLSSETTDQLNKDTRTMGTYVLENAPILMPVILESTYSAVDESSLNARLWLGPYEDTSFNQRARLQDGFPSNTHCAVMTINSFEGRTLRWEMRFRTQVWSSRMVNEEAAGRVPWPREWPAEVADALKPQRFIESDDPIFKSAVEDAAQGRLRMVPPYFAAKDLVRYCILNVKVTRDGEAKGFAGTIRGMRMVGARRALADGDCSQHDLVCICIATLRAAGIPARPVVGMYEEEDGDTELVSWGEFYIPEIGWIPFDPDEMRGSGLKQRHVRHAWKGFASMDELNERIPLAYTFIPPRSVRSPQYPAIWGWDPRPVDNITAQQSLRITMLSRGKGVEDDAGDR